MSLIQKTNPQNNLLITEEMVRIKSLSGLIDSSFDSIYGEFYLKIKKYIVESDVVVGLRDAASCMSASFAFVLPVNCPFEELKSRQYVWRFGLFVVCLVNRVEEKYDPTKILSNTLPRKASDWVNQDPELAPALLVPINLKNSPFFQVTNSIFEFNKDEENLNKAKPENCIELENETGFNSSLNSEGEGDSNILKPENPQDLKPSNRDIARQFIVWALEYAEKHPTAICRFNGNFAFVAPTSFQLASGSINQDWKKIQNALLKLKIHTKAIDGGNFINGIIPGIKGQKNFVLVKEQCIFLYVDR